MIWGISLAAIAIAAGCFWLGKVATRKQPKWDKESYFQQWVRFAFFMPGGMALAVATMPIAGWFGALGWLNLVFVIAFLGMAIGTAVDIAADYKPDKWALTSAKIAPMMLLIAVKHWDQFTGTVGGQMSAYMSHLG